jgi:hypothetical protein
MPKYDPCSRKIAEEAGRAAILSDLLYLGRFDITFIFQPALNVVFKGNSYGIDGC